MIEPVPFHVSVIFILTTLLTVGFLFYAIKISTYDTVAGKAAVTLVSFWILFQGVLSAGGFFAPPNAAFPRFPFFGPLPALAAVMIFAVLFRKKFAERLPLRVLTLLHVIRVPVELVLWWLYLSGEVPKLMTFEGRNFDILAGATAPFVAWLAFRTGRPARSFLLVWNIAALLLLLNIVTNAVLSLEGPFQQFAFEQPNRAVLYFPFQWLPSVVVPIVLFAHIASIIQLTKKDNQP